MLGAPIVFLSSQESVGCEADYTPKGLRDNGSRSARKRPKDGSTRLNQPPLKLCSDDPSLFLD